MEKGTPILLNWTMKNEESSSRQRKEIRNEREGVLTKIWKAGAVSCGHVGFHVT